jgi:hypothetical protein
MSGDPLVSLRTRPDVGGVSKLLLDRYRAGEALTEDERGAVERAIARDAETRAFVEAPLDTPTGLERLQRELGARKQQERRRALRWVPPTIGVLALAALALVVTRPRDPLEATERTKGGSSLSVFVRDESGRVRRALPGEPVHAGEALRFEVANAEPRFVAVVGIDSAGAAAVYAPTHGEPERHSGTHLFEGSLVLDQTVGRERFTAVFCLAPIERRALVDAMTTLGERAGLEAPLGLPGCEEVTLIFAKGVRP